jgi:hypothetical protein
MAEIIVILPSLSCPLHSPLYLTYMFLNLCADGNSMNFYFVKLVSSPTGLKLQLNRNYDILIKVLWNAGSDAR